MPELAPVGVAAALLEHRDLVALLGFDQRARHGDAGEVLMTGDGQTVKAGKDVSGVTVTGKLIETKKGDKVTVFKKRRRNTYRRKIGHRQTESRVQIVAIGKS